MSCLKIVLAIFFGTFGAALAVLLLSYLLRPVGRLIGAYWDWVGKTFRNETCRIVFAVTPIVATILAFLALLVCLAGPV